VSGRGACFRVSLPLRGTVAQVKAAAEG